MASPFNDAYLQRFGGILRLYGTSAVELLINSHVLVVGIGGVGSWIAEALARSGIGQISLMDLDDICITNTNRQIHALHSTIGLSKTHVMKERLVNINPTLLVHCIDDFLDTDNIESAFNITPPCSLIVDAIDNTRIKAETIAYCKRKKQKVITIGSAGGKKDPQRIQHSDLSKTTNDPLLAKVRHQLRRKHHFPKNLKRRFSIEAIYSPEPMTYPDNNGETCQTRAFLKGHEKLDCSSGYGASTMVAATFGFVAASRAIDISYVDIPTIESTWAYYGQAVYIATIRWHSLLRHFSMP